MHDKKIHEVIIIGSGPAGLTAAIYAARGNLSPLVIEGYAAGGQLMLTSEVENYPGFQDGIMGPELMMEFRAQAARFGAEFISKNVTKVDLTAQVKKVWVDEDLYLAKTVIISTGASANLLGLENESRLMGRGVSTCATCDGFFFRDKIITVVGGGDSAMEEATFLTRFASKVYIVHRRQEFRASNIMVDRAMNNPKIEFILDTIVEDVLGDEQVTGVKLKNVQTGQTSELATDGLFIAIGHTPNTGLFEGQIHMDQAGYILTATDKSRVTATNLPGVFACGDVQDSRYRQAITAAGSGCAAALDAEHYLDTMAAVEAAEQVMAGSGMVDWRLGTVGFSYKDWAGVFYPAKMPARSYLAHYSSIFNAVELDSTFYGTPPVDRVKQWAATVPEDFRFCVKTPRQITHEARLSDGNGEMARFLETMQELGSKLGAILIQLPPSFSAAEFETVTAFRHPSWFTGETAHLLRRHNICWTSIDYIDLPKQVAPTSNFLYIRWLGRHGQFKRKDHVQADVRPQLDWWWAYLQPQLGQVDTIYGFFNNDYSGHSPATCNLFKSIIGQPVEYPQIPQQGKLF